LDLSFGRLSALGEFRQAFRFGLRSGLPRAAATVSSAGAGGRV